MKKGERIQGTTDLRYQTLSVRKCYMYKYRLFNASLESYKETYGCHH